ncbi:MAG: DinB family protein [Rhodococcus sp. (in: high G+C Gram-positive bacteria)]|nr:DinB family protein [Rhodococcus sp. (in: high G+C Gram-positive bacteria)]MDI6630490.1 DinB family protein [Rhodococcus sp. (in: high G+C Gram-positive bacteria)]
MKDELHQYLRIARENMLWKLDGLTEYQKRRPMTPTGTNLLGLIKHLAIVEYGYFGLTFGREFPARFAELEAAALARLNSDMWAAADESSEFIVDLYREAWLHADKTIESNDLDTVGRVLHWPVEKQEVTLHRVLVHLVAETNRHAGHADIVRELIDNAVGLRLGNENMTDGDAAWWAAYRAELETVAREAD